MQNKGIVMQIANGHAIVMTKDCEFRKIPLLDEMAIGQEIEFTWPTEQALTKSKRSSRWLHTPWKKTGVLAASLLLAIGVWSGQSMLNPQPAAAYAYVTVDINPSVELSIDAHQKVVSATGLNADGVQVLSGVKLTGLPIKEAVRSLTELAQSKGYLHANTEVLITATPGVDESKLAADHMDLDAMEGDLVNQVKTAVAAQRPDEHVEVEGIRVSGNVYAAAKKAGLSPGKYALYLALQSKGINVPLDEVKNNSITEVVANRGVDASDVLHNLQGGTQLDQLLQQFQNSKSPANQAPGVMPSQNKGPEAGEGSTTNLPPGQAKKLDDKQNATGNGKAKSDDKSSDRESDSKKGNGNHQNPQADDKEHDSGDANAKGDHKGHHADEDQNQQGNSWFQFHLNFGNGHDDQGHDGQDGKDPNGHHDKGHD